jgi:biopolymer transport protein ExbD
MRIRVPDLAPRRVHAGLKSDLNLTPMIDVLLVLLVIFMAAMPLTQLGLDASLPPPAPAAPAPVDTPPWHIVVEYTADRRISVNKQSVAFADLQPRLSEIFASRHDKTLFVSGDASLRYGEIVDVIDAAKGAGVQRVGIITEGMRRAAR